MKKITTEKSGRIRVQTINTEKSLTQQQFKDQTDINNIIAKYKKTGELVHTSRKLGIYADVSNITDYHSSLQKVLDAQNAFSTLPSHIRLRFHNNPEELLRFLQNPENISEGITLGLLEQTPESKQKTQNETKPDPNQNKNETQTKTDSV